MEPQPAQDEVVPEVIPPTAEELESAKLERERDVKKCALDQLLKHRSQMKDKDLFDDLLGAENPDEHDDDDDDADEGVDYNAEESDVSTNRIKRGYQPAATSAVGFYLKKFQREAVGNAPTRNNDLYNRIVKGQHYFAPEEPDPVAAGEINASHWYLNNTWIYVFCFFHFFNTSRRAI